MKILLRSFAASLAALLFLSACSGSGELLFNAATVTVQKVAGDAQTGLATYPVNIPPAVKVSDASGHPVAGVQVVFNVTSGGGSITGGVATTGSDGIAAVGSWTVPLGSNTLSATVPRSSGPVSFSATGVLSGYNIDVRFLSSVTVAQKEAFDSATAHWQRLIFGDVTDIPFTSPAGACLGNEPAMNETIDDIVIFATLDSIDGPGGILGMAGPCYIRLSNNQPLLGVMRFDTADVGPLITAGKFDEVVLHEMGHVLGFGTVWSPSFDNLLVGGGGSDPHFIGIQATSAFNRSGGTSYTAGQKVPVENCLPPTTCPGGGAGTRDSHWRKTVFGPELMTGFLSSGVTPLSVVTVAAMGDEGYQVNYAGADSYALSLAAAMLRAQGATTEIHMSDDILRLPIRVVNERGRVMRVVRQK